MGKIVVALNVLSGLYFFLAANFFFWGPMIVFISGIVNTGQQNDFNDGLLSVLFLFGEVLLAPFAMYTAVMFFRKTQRKYLFGEVLLVIALISTESHRLITVTQFHWEQADFINLLVFGIPLGIIYISRMLDQKYSRKA